MNRTLKMLLAGAALVPGLALAQDSGMSYSYVEAGWMQVDPDGFDKVDGWQIGGSIELGDMWHINANFNQIDSDLDIYRVGGGVHYGLNDSVDLVGNLSWVKWKADGGIDEDGFGLYAGLRGKVMESMELEGGVDYVDFGGNAGDATRFVGAARYFFTPAFAAGVNLSFGDYAGDDAKIYGVDFRYNFK